MIIDFVLNVMVTIVGVLLGAYILFFGRRELWLTLGIVGLAATANLARRGWWRTSVPVGSWSKSALGVWWAYPSAVGALGVGSRALPDEHCCGRDSDSSPEQASPCGCMRLPPTWSPT